MAENQNREQRARAFDSQTLQYVNEALKEQALVPTVEAIAAESMTLNYVQVNLNSASVEPAKAQPHGSIKGNTSEK